MSFGSRSQVQSPNILKKNSGAGNVGTESGRSVQIELNDLGITVSDIDSLRASTATGYNRANVRYYRTANDDGGGVFYLDALDTTSADDGGYIIVDAIGNRWKRPFYGDILLSEYGLIGDDSADDTAAMLAAFARADAFGGAVVNGRSGAIYRTTLMPAMGDDVKFNMRGSRINADLGSGNVYGLRIGPKNSGVKNGKIYINSVGESSSQFIFHAAISIGNPNGAGGTVSSKDKYAEVQNWVIENMELSTNREHCPVIQGMGDCYNGRISNIVIPDSDKCSGIHFDWSDISVAGTITSANIPLAKTTYLAGDGYTTHPHSIVIENIKCGNLSVPPSGDLGSRIVRLSACYHITCKNLYADRTTLQAVINVGGDLGYEFAPDVSRAFAQQGIVFENVVCEQCDYQGAFFDTYADNVQREADNNGYVPLFDTIIAGDISLRNAVFRGSNVDGSVGDAVRLQDVNGVRLSGVVGTQHKNGIAIEAYTDNVTVDGSRMYRNIEDGYNVLNATTIDNVTFINNRAELNAIKAGNFGGFNIAGGNRIVLRDNDAGAANESSQNFGFKINTTARRVSFTNNRCHEVSNDTDVAFNLGSDSKAYDVFWECFGNEYLGSVSINPIAGVDLITTKSTQLIGGNVVREMVGNASGLSADTTPTQGDFVQGDKIFFSNAAANSDIGSVCVASGTPGTWRRFGAINA